MWVVNTKVGALRSGDYSLRGHEEDVAIERKSKADLFGTVGAGRARFERELSRLNRMKFAAVVVEADVLEIETAPPDRSVVTPSQVLGSAMSWQFRYPNVRWYFLPTRQHAERWTVGLLSRFQKYIATPDEE